MSGPSTGAGTGPTTGTSTDSALSEWISAQLQAAPDLTHARAERLSFLLFGGRP